MEFFGYLGIPRYVLQFIRGDSGGMSLDELYVMLGVAGACYFFCLAFSGIALFAMGERAEVKHSYLGFIPFANTYYAGKLAGETSFFGRRVKRAGLYAMLAEIVYVVLQVFSLVTSVLVANPAYYETNVLESGSVSLMLDPARIPAGVQWAARTSGWFAVAAFVSELVMIVFFCIVYNGLYRKYNPRWAYALTVFSVLFPVRAYLMYGIKDRTALDFNEYIKNRLEQAMREAGVQINREKEASEPFRDFENKSASAPSPFAEFEEPATPSTPADFPAESNDSDE